MIFEPMFKSWGWPLVVAVAVLLAAALVFFAAKLRAHKAV